MYTGILMYKVNKLIGTQTSINQHTNCGMCSLKVSHGSFSNYTEQKRF